MPNVGFPLGFAPPCHGWHALSQFVRGEEALVTQTGEDRLTDVGEHGEQEPRGGMAVGFGQGGAADAVHLIGVQVEVDGRFFPRGAAKGRFVTI